MIDALRSENPTHRTVALGAAARLQIFDDNVLTDALSDPSPAVRTRALELAARRPPGIDPASAADRVVEMLADPACAETAAFTLGELGVATPAVAAALEHQAGHHDDPLCREAAVAALGALGVGLAAVLAATDDIAPVRRRAVVALAAFDGPEVDAALVAALDDRDWQVRQLAEDLI